MGKQAFPGKDFDVWRLRLIALIPLVWVIFLSLIPDFVMRISGHRILWLSAASWGIGFLLVAGFTGYLVVKVREERWISLLVFIGIAFLVISEAMRIGLTLNLFNALVDAGAIPKLRAMDNLLNGLGLVLIALAFLRTIIKMLASRQQLLAEHARLRAEIERREQVERDLRARETLLQGISTSALDGIIVMDNAGCVSYWNPAAERILGYSAQEMIGIPLHEKLVSAGLQTEYPEGVLAWQGSGGGSIVGSTTELRALTKAGAEIDVELSVSSMKISEQWNAVGILRDVTERKKLEKALRDNEERFRIAVDCANDFVYERDMKTGQAEFFGGFETSLGYAIGEFPRTFEGWMERIHPDDIAHVTECFEESLENGGRYALEYRLRRKDGSYARWWDRGVILTDALGNSSRTIGAATDITASRSAQDKLQESEEKYRTLIEDSIEGIGISTGNQVVFANRALLDIFGYGSLDAFVQVPLFDLIAPESHLVIREKMRQQESGQPPEPLFEIKIRRKDGAIRDVQVQTAEITIGNKPFMQSMFRDVTEWKQAEAERRNLETQIQHAQKLESLGVLAGGIAHDFNNILHLILGNLYHMKQIVPATSPARSFVDNIERSANRAAGLTHQMLAYSGKGHFFIQILDIGTVISEIIHLVQSSISKKVTLNMDLATELPLIKGDASQIQQIAMNLVLNAAEALDEEQGGRVDVSTKALHCTEEYLSGNRAMERLPEGEYVCLEVSDTGCGMSGETKERLFDPFFTTKFTGRGLGMSAVLGIVRGHKGAILVESADGRGTTIRVLFPVAAQPAPAASEEGPGASVSLGELAGTVLFVDDEPDMLELGALTLTQMGCSVITAADGLEAIEIFKARCEEIDCVLLDLSMPRMDGRQTLSELRRIKPALRALLASGYTEHELATRFAGEKVEAFIEKPYSAGALYAKLRKVLG